MESCMPILTPVWKRLKLRKNILGKFVGPTNIRRMIRSSCYLTSTGLYIVVEVGFISELIESSCHSHLQATKWLYDTSMVHNVVVIFIQLVTKIELVRFTNGNYIGDIENRSCN